MVGRVGYAPTTPAMSMQYSTIELTARKSIKTTTFSFFFSTKKILVLLLIAYINDKFIKNKVILKSVKNEPLGNRGKKTDNK